jgi:GAF domain-containing protein
MRQDSHDSGSRMDGAQSLLETVHEISREISAHLASEQGLQNVCQRLADMLTVDYVLAVSCDQVSAEGTIIAEYPTHPGKNIHLTLEGFGAYRQLQTDHSPVVVEHVDTGADLLGPNQPFFQSLDLQALFMAPLVAQDDLVGFVILGTGTSGRTFSQDERYAIQTVAAQLAISLRNAELLLEIQRQVHAARQRVQYEESLGEIVSHLQQQADLRVMLQQIMQDLGHVLGARRARVRLQVTPSEPGGTKLSE